MRRWSVRWRDVAVVALLVVGAGTVGADEALKVTKLRTEKVTFYDCQDGSKKGEFARKDFQGSWPIIQGGTAPASGLVRVKVGEVEHCVRAYAVETNKPIAASAECGAMVAMNQPKSAATRGLGEECKK